jgi:hypothetical protein
VELNPGIFSGGVMEWWSGGVMEWWMADGLECSCPATTEAAPLA